MGGQYRGYNGSFSWNTTIRGQRPPKLSKQDKELARKYYRNGEYSIEGIAYALGVSSREIRRAVK